MELEYEIAKLPKGTFVNVVGNVIEASLPDGTFHTYAIAEITSEGRVVIAHAIVSPDYKVSIGTTAGTAKLRSTE